MPPLPGNAKVEELRFRLKTDPKSRLFYPLAEELRKINQFDEAEQTLRSGLTHHPTYLSAWVCLGRVLRDRHNDSQAVEALTRALQIDPGNVVAARLLADAYLALGEKVEAIKKYKLVQALMPGDNDMAATIERLDRELTPIAPAAISVEEEPPPLEPMPMPMPEPEPQPAPIAESAPEPMPEPIPFPAAEAEAAEAPPEAPLEATVELPFDTELEQAHEVFIEEQREEMATADVEPMRVAHDESPFEEPVTDFTAAAVEIEAPLGMHIEEAPLAADVATPWDEEQLPADAALEAEAADVFAPAAEEPALSEEPTNTVTMGDLYASQGLTDDARRIYENILQRDPGNDAVRAKLERLEQSAAAPSPAARRSATVSRLERWLSKVARREVSGV